MKSKLSQRTGQSDKWLIFELSFLKANHRLASFRAQLSVSEAMRGIQRNKLWPKDILNANIKKLFSFIFRWGNSFASLAISYSDGSIIIIYNFVSCVIEE